MAAPTFVAAGSDLAVGGNAENAIFDWADHAGVADGDIAFHAIYKESTASYTATPPNWQQVVGAPWDQDTGGFKYRADLWWRRRSGDTGTATWSWSGFFWRYSSGVVYRNPIATETPILSPTVDVETTGGAEPVHPGITIQRANSGLVWVVFNFSDTGNTAAPAGFTYRQPAGTSDRNILTYDDLTTAPGATGTITGNISVPDFALSVLLELTTEEAGGAASPFPPHPRPDARALAPVLAM